MSSRRIKKLTFVQNSQQSEDSDIEITEPQKSIFSPKNGVLEIDYIDESDNQSVDEQNIKTEPTPVIENKALVRMKPKKKKKKKKNVVHTVQPEQQDLILESEIITTTNDDFLDIKKKCFDYTTQDYLLYKSFKNKTRTPLKSSVFLVPHRPEWTAIKYGNITMEIYQKLDGLYLAKYEYDLAYKEISRTFYYMCQINNEEELANLFSDNSTHVESLYRYGFLGRVTQDPTAFHKEFIERAIYILEKSKNIEFSFFKRKHRLLYNIYENRTLHLCLFVHLLNVSDLCCYRTSLEICKLLLVLDPSDPLGVLCFIDYYCIKSKNYKAFIQFYESNTRYDFAALPNMRFSYAICKYYISESSDEILRDALLDFRYFFGCLQNTCKVIVPDDIRLHNLFNIKLEYCPQASLTLMAMYLSRTQSVIRDSIFNLLLENARKCMDLYDQFMISTERKIKHFHEYPLAILRHAFLTRYEDKYIKIEMDKHSTTLINDPFPPISGINSYISSLNFAEPRSYHPDPMIELILTSLNVAYNFIIRTYSRLSNSINSYFHT